jgi:hypothetical protein
MRSLIKDWKLCGFLFICILIHVAIGIWFILKTPLSPMYTDWSMYIPVIKEITLTGNIPTTFPLFGHVGFPRFMPLTVNYPSLYFILTSMLYPFWGDKTGAWLELFSSTMSIIIVFLIFSKLYNKSVGLISAFILSISFGTIFSTWDQDIFIVFPELLILLIYLRYIENKKLSNIFIMAILSALIIGTKQSAYFFLIPIVAHFLFFSKFKLNSNINGINKYKELVTLILLVTLLSFPIVNYQIDNTGTLSTWTPDGWPVVDTYIFHPKYLDIEDWQKDIDEKVDFETIKERGTYYYYKKYGSLSLFKHDPIKYVNEQFNTFYVCKAMPLTLRNIPIPMFLTVLYTIGFLIFISKIDIKRSVLLFILLGNILVLVITSKSEYFVVGSFLWVLFPSLSINSISKKRYRYICLFLILVVTISALSSTIMTSHNASNYMQNYVAQETHINEVGMWIMNHTTKNDIIMEVHPSFPYYSNRVSFWDFRLFFLDREDLIYYLSNYHRPKYIVIYDFQITEKDWINWWWIPQDSPFLKLLNDQEYFIEQYHTGENHIYRFVKLYPRNDS